MLMLIKAYFEALSYCFFLKQRFFFTQNKVKKSITFLSAGVSCYGAALNRTWGGNVS